jgi:ferrous-iron efflux pump FieF
VVTASVLGGAKLVAALFTGSLALAGSFVDSLMDVFASSVNLIAIRIGSRPADEEHRYGHGKAEGLAGMFQGSVVGFSGVFLVVESVRRLLFGGGIAHEAVGLWVMAASTVVSLALTVYLRRTARATDSTALRADSVHYASDVWMNLGVFGAFLLVVWTGADWVDPVVGLLVAALVLASSWSVIRASIDELMDAELGAETCATISERVEREVPEARRISEMRTRRAGSSRFVDLTVSFDRRLSFAEAHRLSERVREAVLRAVPGALVQVHADPDPLLPEDAP